MDEFNVTPRDLASMERLGLVSSGAGAPEKDRWTNLSIFYRAGYNRPIVAVVEGWEWFDRLRGSDGYRRFAFKFVCVGTLERALRWFDDSDLTDSLRAQVGGWTPEPLPAQVAPALRLLGYTGTDRLTDALAWLYRDPDATDFALAKRLQRDFAVGERNVRNALAAERDGGRATAVWLPPFIGALRYFDRHAWAETITSLDVVPMTTAATSPARSSKGNPDAA